MQGPAYSCAEGRFPRAGRDGWLAASGPRGLYARGTVRRLYPVSVLLLATACSTANAVKPVSDGGSVPTPDSGAGDPTLDGSVADVADAAADATLTDAEVIPPPGPPPPVTDAGPSCVKKTCSEVAAKYAGTSYAPCGRTQDFCGGVQQCPTACTYGSCVANGPTDLCSCSRSTAANDALFCKVPATPHLVACQDANVGAAGCVPVSGQTTLFCCP